MEKKDTTEEASRPKAAIQFADGDPTLERVAGEVHQVWCRWMMYMFNSQTAAAIARWERQMQTPYAQLSEEEKASDREIARRYLDIVLSTRSLEHIDKLLEGKIQC